MAGGMSPETDERGDEDPGGGDQGEIAVGGVEPVVGDPHGRSIFVVMIVTVFPLAGRFLPRTA